MNSSIPQFGLAIDWETSGSSWGKDSSIEYQGVSFGALIFDTSTFEPVDGIYKEIRFNGDRFKWSLEAEAIHGLSRDYLDANGVDQDEAAVDLLELILKYFGPDGRVMFLGHNPQFDIRFTNQLLNSVEFEFSVEQHIPEFQHIQVHHVVLDTSALGFITLGKYRSNDLFERMGFEKRGAHSAFDDIMMTLETCKIIRSKMDGITIP